MRVAHNLHITSFSASLGCVRLSMPSWLLNGDELRLRALAAPSPMSGVY